MIHASTQEQVGERFRLAAHATGFGVWEWFPGDNRVLWDDKLHEIYEFDPTTNLDKTDYFYGIVHPDDKRYIDEQMSDLLANPKDHKYFEQICRIVVPSGKTKIVRTYGEVYAEGSEVHSIVGISRDISEHENLKTDLQNSQQQLTMICENLNDMIVLHKFDATTSGFEIAFVNNTFMQTLRLLGNRIRKEELERLSLNDYLSTHLRFTDHQINDRIKRFRGVLKSGKTERFIEESDHFGERAMVLESVIKPIVRGDGEQFVLWISKDITPLVRARKEMSINDSKYKLLSEQIDAIIFCVDEEGNPVEVSPNMKEYLGYTAQEIISGEREFWSTIVEDEGLFEKSLHALFQRRIPIRTSCNLFHKDGTLVALDLKADSILDEKGRLQAFGTLSRTEG